MEVPQSTLQKFCFLKISSHQSVSHLESMVPQGSQYLHKRANVVKIFFAGIHLIILRIS